MVSVYFLILSLSLSFSLTKLPSRKIEIKLETLNSDFGDMKKGRIVIQYSVRMPNGTGIHPGGCIQSGSREETGRMARRHKYCSTQRGSVSEGAGRKGVRVVQKSRQNQRQMLVFKAQGLKLCEVRRLSAHSRVCFEEHVCSFSFLFFF